MLTRYGAPFVEDSRRQTRGNGNRRPRGSRRGAKPRLLVDPANSDITVEALRDILSGAKNLYDRGAPVRLAIDRTRRSGSTAQALAPDDLVLLAHQIARPYVEQAVTGRAIDVRLPSLIARMYLGWRGEWKLPPLNGIASAPLLSEDGKIARGSGYDPPPASGRRTSLISAALFLNVRHAPRRMWPSA